jgi:hypothetical protein
VHNRLVSHLIPCSLTKQISSLHLSNPPHISPTIPPSIDIGKMEPIAHTRNLASTGAFTTRSSALSKQSYQSSNALTQEEIEAKEWKYTGYQHYSKFLASDNDFLVFRRFAGLNVRVALAIQDEIAILEHKLATLDQESSEKMGPDIHNGSFRADTGSARANLIQDRIYHKLKKYSMFIFQ